MPQITYIAHNGETEVVEVQNGSSVMEGAIANGIPGIVAECGGAASCATCHVYVDERWLGALEPMSEDEDAMLDCTASERRPASRLSCQIKLEAKLDGLVVRLPEVQS